MCWGPTVPKLAPDACLVVRTWLATIVITQSLPSASELRSCAYCHMIAHHTLVLHQMCSAP